MEVYLLYHQKVHFPSQLLWQRISDKVEEGGKGDDTHTEGQYFDPLLVYGEINLTRVNTVKNRVHVRDTGPYPSTPSGTYWKGSSSNDNQKHILNCWWMFTKFKVSFLVYFMLNMV
jgi:hypothetical protein